MLPAAAVNQVSVTVDQARCGNLALIRLDLSIWSNQTGIRLSAANC